MDAIELTERLVKNLELALVLEKEFSPITDAKSLSINLSTKEGGFAERVMISEGLPLLKSNIAQLIEILHLRKGLVHIDESGSIESVYHEVVDLKGLIEVTVQKVMTGELTGDSNLNLANDLNEILNNIHSAVSRLYEGYEGIKK